MKFQFDLGNTSTVAPDTSAKVSRIEEMYAAWQEHLKECETTSLADSYNSLGFVEEESKGGYPQISHGKGVGVLADNTKAAINALLGIASKKYQVLEWNYHVSWFNPTKDAKAVVSKWDDDAAVWRFFDWKNGTLVPTSKMTPEHRERQSNKHFEIDRFLQAKKFGNKFLVVMNFQDELEHYHRVIRDRLEMTLPEVWEEIAKDWSAAKTNKQLRNTNGGSSRPTSVAPSEDRKAFVAELSKLNKDVLVKYDIPQQKGLTILFMGSNDAAAAQQLVNFLSAPPSVEYKSYEAVEA